MFKLGNVILENKKMVENTNVPTKAVCENLSKQCGFTVTESNLKMVLRTVLKDQVVRDTKEGSLGLFTAISRQKQSVEQIQRVLLLLANYHFDRQFESLDELEQSLTK